jgi:chloride channel protein, CIC family
VPPSFRREILLTGLAAFIGVAGGGAAWVLVHLIGLTTNLALLHRWGWDLPSFTHFHPDWGLFVAAIGGAAIVSLLARWSPVIRGHGLPEAMEAVLLRNSRVAPRTAIAKPLSAAVAIGTGGPFGAEGPIIVTGGAIGSLLGQLVRLTATERKFLLACGAAAGMSATFGAPMAAIVLAIELLLFEFSARAILPLAIASGIAAAMHTLLFDAHPIFHVPHHDYEGMAHLPSFALLGLACGLLSVVVCRGLYLVERIYRRLPFGEAWHPLVGALGFATIGLFVPRALGVGYDQIDDVLANRLALGTLVVVLGAKLVMWWVALGSGTSGGTLAPLLLIGGAFGGTLGAIAGQHAWGVGAPGALALVGMAATFGAAARVPLTAIVFAFELTHDYEAIAPLIIATVLADLVNRALLDHGLMTEKLARRGVMVPMGYEPDALRHTTVREAMSTPVVSLPANSSVAAARRLMAQHPHSAYPLVDRDGRLVAMLTRAQLAEAIAVEEACVIDVALGSPPTVRSDDTLETVLDLIVDEDADHVPVVDGGSHVIGMCTRTDLLAARAKQREHHRLLPRSLALRKNRDDDRSSGSSTIQ